MGGSVGRRDDPRYRRKEGRGDPHLSGGRRCGLHGGDVPVHFGLRAPHHGGGNGRPAGRPPCLPLEGTPPVRRRPYAAAPSEEKEEATKRDAAAPAQPNRGGGASASTAHAPFEGRALRKERERAAASGGRGGGGRAAVAEGASPASGLCRLRGLCR